MVLNCHATEHYFYTAEAERKGRMDEVCFRELESWLVAYPKFRNLPLIHFFDCCLSEAPSTAIAQEVQCGRYVPGKDCLRLFATSPGELRFAESDGAIFSKRLRTSFEALLADFQMVEWEKLCRMVCGLTENDLEHLTTPERTGNKSSEVILMPGRVSGRVAQGGNRDFCQIIFRDGSNCERRARGNFKCALHQKVKLGR